MLKELRAKLEALRQRAAAKAAEARDDMAPDAVRKIEDEHQAILKEIGDTEKRIAEIEAEEARQASHSTEREAALVAERARAAEITSLAVRHAMPEAFAPEHINKGTKIEDVRTIVLEEVAKRTGGTHISPRVQVLTDEGDTIRQAVGTAILLRANPRAVEVKADDPSRNFRGMTLLEAGRAFVEETQGVKLRGLGRRELAGVLLGLDRAAGMLSTSDFPNILANVASKRLRDAYQAAPQNWKLISRQSNNPDFKTKSVVQLSNLPTFSKVKEGGEYSYAALSDGAASYALATYGKIVPITRQTLINDDLGAFDRIPTLLGRGAAETEASIFWALFTANTNTGATMEDGHPLFDATNHGNYTSSGTDISVTSLDIGRQAMRTQKGFGASAEPLNLAPKFLLVSPAKETKAQMFIASITATKGGDVNPFANSLTQITEARLSGNGWYLTADPALIDTIEYAYLEGEEGLYTETRIGFEVDGIEVKGRLDFAAHIIDYRGFYYNAGA